MDPDSVPMEAAEPLIARVRYLERALAETQQAMQKLMSIVDGQAVRLDQHDRELGTNNPLPDSLLKETTELSTSEIEAWKKRYQA